MGTMPESSYCVLSEGQTWDRGKLARASRNYATVISHSPETKKTHVKLPSGSEVMSTELLLAAQLTNLS